MHDRHLLQCALISSIPYNNWPRYFYSLSAKRVGFRVKWTMDGCDFMRRHGKVESTYLSNGDRMQWYLEQGSMMSRERGSTGMVTKNLGSSELDFMYFHCRPNQCRSHHQCVFYQLVIHNTFLGYMHSGRAVALQALEESSS